jgi:hypothetical protein
MRELQLIGFSTDRSAVQRGVSLSWGGGQLKTEKWRKLAARLPPAFVETKPISEQHKRGQNGLSLSMLSPRPCHHLVATIAAQGVRGAPYRTTGHPV